MSLREAVVDTFFAVLINTPVNFAIIAVAFHYQWSPTSTSLLLTAIFTVLAIIRKTWIRIRFYKKYGG